MTKQEKKMREIISNQTMADLLDEWELTSKMKITVELAFVRGLLMDEFENRNPEAYNEWLDSDKSDDMELRNYMN